MTKQKMIIRMDLVAMKCQHLGVEIHFHSRDTFLKKANLMSNTRAELSRKYVFENAILLISISV